MAISSKATGLRPGVCTSTTRPTAPYNGQVIYETDSKQTLVWQGSAWVMLTDADTPPGLQLIETKTFTTQVTVTFTNCFSSAFDSYKVVGRNLLGSSQYGLGLKMGSTATGYYGSLFYDRYDGAVTNYVRANNGTYTDTCLLDTTANGGCTFDIHSPYAAQNTVMNGTYYGRGYGGWWGAYLNNTTSYTDCSFFNTQGGLTTISGTISIFGYRNSI